VLNSKLANILFPFDFSLLFNLQVYHSNMAMDMEVNTSRGRSINSSTNSSRVLLVHFNTSFIIYTEYYGSNFLELE